MSCYQFITKTLKTLNNLAGSAIVNKLPNVDGFCSQLAMIELAVKGQKSIHPLQCHSLLPLFQALLLV